VFLQPRILEVVGVHNADHVLKLVRPARAVSIPVEVFGLLQDRDVVALGDSDCRAQRLGLRV
jgi:hypothetical protein